jgi:hypothetical protein
MFEVLFEVLDKSAAKKAPATAAKSGLHVVAGAQPVTAAVNLRCFSSYSGLPSVTCLTLFFRNSSFLMKH